MSAREYWYLQKVDPSDKLQYGGRISAVKDWYDAELHQSRERAERERARYSNPMIWRIVHVTVRKKSDDVARLEKELAECETLRGVALRDVQHAEALRKKLTALLEATNRRATEAERIATDALRIGLAECNAARVATRFAHSKRMEAADEAQDNLQRAREAERIANEAMRVGLAECERLRRHVSGLRGTIKGLKPVSDAAAEVSNCVRLSMRLAGQSLAADAEKRIRESALDAAIEQLRNTSRTFAACLQETNSIDAGIHAVLALKSSGGQVKR